MCQISGDMMVKTNITIRINGDKLIAINAELHDLKFVSFLELKLA